MKKSIVTEEIEEALRELADKNYLMELTEARNEIIRGKGREAKKVFRDLGV